MADTTDDPKIEAEDESYVTPPLAAEEIPACECVGLNVNVNGSNWRLAFHGTHGRACPRFCLSCLIKHPCHYHRDVNYIFYRDNPLPGVGHEF